VTLYSNTVGVGGVYSDLVTWDAANGGAPTKNLTTDGNSVEALIIGDVVAGYPTLDLIGWAADAINSMTIRANTGAEFNPTTMTGARLIDQTSNNFGAVLRSGGYLFIKNLGITFSNAVNDLFYEESAIIAQKCTIYGCTTGVSKHIFINNSHFSNCIFILSAPATANNGAGIIFKEVLKNCTIICKLGSGAFNGDIVCRESDMTNTVVYNENTKTSYNSIYSPTSLLTCAQNNNGSSALGAGHVEGITTADFTDYANGDYSVAPGSSLIDAGTDLSAEFTTDIVGTVRG